MPRPTQSSGHPKPGGFLAQNPFPVSAVRIIRAEGTADKTITETHCHVQPDTGYFDFDTPVFEGDIVEMPDPRPGAGGHMRKVASKVDIYDAGRIQYIHVTWGAAPAVRTAPIRRLTFENLHPEVQAAAGDLFADGHFESAVSEAFKSIEVRARSVSGVEKSGADLMAAAFRSDGSVLDVAGHEGRSGEDEREGFMHIFRGAMIGVRNPGAHELFKPGDPQQALEYLGFASLLHRRIDAAESKKRQ